MRKSVFWIKYFGFENGKYLRFVNKKVENSYRQKKYTWQCGINTVDPAQLLSRFMEDSATAALDLETRPRWLQTYAPAWINLAISTPV